MESSEGSEDSLAAELSLVENLGQSPALDRTHRTGFINPDDLHSSFLNPDPLDFTEDGEENSEREESITTLRRRTTWKTWRL